MNGLTFARWKRYGKDRVYVTASDGNKLGYRDLATADVVPEPGIDAPALAVVTAQWCAENGISLAGTEQPGAATPVPPGTPTTTPTESTDPPPPLPEQALPSEQLWTDLAAHRPGEGVRQMAEAEWAASKDRSKVFAALNRYVFDNHTDERAWRKGAEGEEFVGMKLDKLRDKGWRVLHSVPVGKGDSDIDHIAFGPGGVFTVNSKNHASKKIWVSQYTMMVNGQKVPYLRNSRHEAARAKKLLDAHLDFDVPVMGCVVVLTGSLVPEVTYKQMPDDVRVLDKWDVPRWFKKRPEVLSPDQVELVFNVARRSTTWK